MLTKHRRRPGALLTLFMSLSLLTPAYCTVPVIDWSNLIESIKQTAAQVEQHKTQLQQYQMMLKNSTAPSAYTWDQANLTITQLLHSIDTLNHYKQQAGSLDVYLSRYQPQDYYRRSPCFNGGCTPSQLDALRQQHLNASDAQKRANDAMLRGIDQQQTTLIADARQLALLQKQAEGAAGQMAAIQSANQLASAETNQLLHIRGLLMAAQTSEATRLAAVADKEAMQAAADERFRSGRFRKSPPKSW